MHYPDRKKVVKGVLQFIFRWVQFNPMKIKTAHQLYMKEVAARRRKVLKMRDQGMTWKVIAATLGVTRQRAQQIGRIG